MSKKKGSAAYLSSFRNIGIIAHIDAGKTTLTERILFYSGRIHRMGEVHDGTATMDFMPEEQERGITIASALTSCPWRDKFVSIIDTPGHVDFTIEVERSLRVLDGAVGVFCGVSGVEPQSETVWRQSEHYRVPKLAFVNKMDRLGADFEAVLKSMKERLKANVLPVIIPDGGGQELTCLYDVLAMKKLVFDQATDGLEYSTKDITEAEMSFVGPWQERFLETLAEVDDEVMEGYLEGRKLDVPTLQAAVRRATLARKVVPVFSGSALKNMGVQPVLDAVCDFLPSPAEVPPAQGVSEATGEPISYPPAPSEPLSALCFKVSMESGRKLVLMRLYSGTLEAGAKIYNAAQKKDERVARLFRLHAGRKEKLEQARAGEIVAAAGMKFARTGDTLCEHETALILEQIADYKPVISLAIEPQNSDEADKLDEVLQKFLLEDPTLTAEPDEDTGQVILSGMGELHLDVVLERLRREYNLSPRTGKPQVVYQETVGSAAEGEGEFDRELGDDKHYGQVRVRVEPLERGSGCDVAMEQDPDQWPAPFLEAVEEGISDALQSGVLKGYPVQDVRVRVTELGRKEGESTAVGYRMASAMALKDALQKAGPLLLEPIMWLEINVPEEFVGDVIGLLGAKGAKIENMLDRSDLKLVQALASLRDLFGFSTDLRSATQGRAAFIMRFAKFDVLD